MSLMGSLYTGVSGLQTSNNALNTTAHNMSNLDTVGYTRQQVAQSTRPYVTISKNNKTNWKQIGLGVKYSRTRQERDIFLDKNYRRESGRSAFYSVSSSAMEEIEYILGESQAGEGGSNEGHEFSRSLTNLWTSIQELSKDPTSSVNQNLFVTRSYEFITKASAVYTSLCQYQDNLNKQVVKEVNNINAYAQEIETLNEKIVTIEAGDVERANDLRDRRNYLLDQLAQLGSVSYEENMSGYVNVKFEGVDLVKGGLVNKMELYTHPKTGFYSPYWTMLANFDYDKDGNRVVTAEGIAGAEVFDLTREISTTLNTDIGSLKAMLLHRGDHRATYKEIKNFPPDADPNDPTQAQDEWYDMHVSQSVVMNIQAEFDQLVNIVVSKINGILAEEAGRVGESDYLRDENGEPYQMFQLLNDNGEFTVSNLMINPDLRQNPSLLSFRKDEHSEDYPIMEKLKAAFEEKVYTLNPNVETPVGFLDYYKNLVAQVANTGSVLRGIEATQTQATDALMNAREQVVGVSSDEELTHMIRFQNAYNASSRYINVISEMLEHILTTLGR